MIKSQQHDSAHALLESESRYKMIFENANDGIIIHDTQGQIFDVNPTMYNRLGYTKKEMLKMSLNDLVAPEFGRQINERMKRLEKDGVAIFESADRRKDGTFMPVEVSARYAKHKGQTVIQSIVRDIHKRKLAEDLISKSLKDKETILDEINRRVRRDQQTYVRILDNIVSSTGHVPIEAAIESARSRIESIALIQDKIYRLSNFSRIDFSQALRSVVTYLNTQYRVGTRNIQIKQKTHNIPLDMSTAIPAALITYELLSNSLRHAFPGRKGGQITLKFSQNKNLQHVLTVQDDGRGFPSEIDFRQTKTLGMQLVMDLVGQLEGKIELRINNGTTCVVRFP